MFQLTFDYRFAITEFMFVRELLLVLMNIQAWSFHIAMKSNNSPENVFVLIRLYNVRTDPELVLFVDPWQLHTDGVLSLTT